MTKFQWVIALLLVMIGIVAWFMLADLLRA